MVPPGAPGEQTEQLLEFDFHTKTTMAAASDHSEPSRARAGKIARRTGGLVVLLLLAALPAFGLRQFNRRLAEEQKALQSNFQPAGTNAVTEADLQRLPPIVQQWLRHSGVVGKPMVNSLRLTQSGKMKLKPEGNWMNFSATLITAA